MFQWLSLVVLFASSVLSFGLKNHVFAQPENDRQADEQITDNWTDRQTRVAL